MKKKPVITLFNTYTYLKTPKGEKKRVRLLFFGLTGLKTTFKLQSENYPEMWGLMQETELSRFPCLSNECKGSCWGMGLEESLRKHPQRRFFCKFGDLKWNVLPDVMSYHVSRWSNSQNQHKAPNTFITTRSFVSSTGNRLQCIYHEREQSAAFFMTAPPPLLLTGRQHICWPKEHSPGKAKRLLWYLLIVGEIPLVHL